MADTAERYRGFAREAHGRSAAYQALAEAVAGDGTVLGFLSTLPEAKRQPNLLFAAARYLLGEPAELHGFVPPWAPLFWELCEHDADSLLRSGDAWQQVLAVLRAQGEEAPVFEKVYVESIQRLEAIAGQDHVRWYDLMRIILSWGLWRRPREERRDRRLLRRWSGRR